MSTPSRKLAERTSPSGGKLPVWAFGLLFFVALQVAFLVYGPAMEGPFLFDDLGLPFYAPSFAEQPLSGWVAGVRPILMFTYWLNFQTSERQPWAYHSTNVFIHTGTAILIFFLFFRILRLRSIEPRRSYLCAGVAATLFLIHPLQTEAVAYIAGRSELVAGLFVAAALVVYCNPSLIQVSWRTSLLVLFFYGCAVLSKEHAVVLPVILLAVDLFLRERSIRQTLQLGRRLYYPILAAGALAIAGVFALLTRSTSAGFNVEFKWYEYLFTQFRVWLLYLKLAILPVGQNADYDLPVSRSLDSSLWALLGLIGIAVAAWRYRNRFPIAFFGILSFAILLAPTSSVIPIQDLAAERRMYLPLAGLLIVLLEALSRTRLNTRATVAVSAVLVICSALTYDRSKVWSSDIAFWSDTVAQSPGKLRGYTHLTYAYIRMRRCSDAASVAEKAPQAAKDTPELLGMLGHAYACEHRMNDAVQAFERAVQVAPAVGRYLTLASIYRQVGREGDAQTAEEQALRIPPKTAHDFTVLEGWQKSRDQTRARPAPVTPGG